MFFKDAGYRFPQFDCRADIDTAPLFPEVFEPHVIQGVTDEDIRVIRFKVEQLVAFVLNRVQVAVDFTGVQVAVDFTGVDGIPDGLHRMTDGVNGAINIICYTHFNSPSRF